MSRQKYTIEYLKEYCGKYNILLNSLIFDEWKGRDTIINGNCNMSLCNNNFMKRFRQLDVGCGPYCVSCTIKIQQDKTKKKNLELRGVENPMQSKEVREKSKRTNLKIRGVEYPSQSTEVKEKKKQTCMLRYGITTNLLLPETIDKIKETTLKQYGVVNPSQSEEIKIKMKKANLRIRGVENPMQSEEVKLKKRQTNLERYGVIYPVQLQQTKEKSKQTCLLKYGVEYPMQNEKVSEKSGKCAYRVKEYIFPSGNTIFVQGYEPFALDILIDENIHEDDIITSRKNIPEIWYNSNNKKKRYYVDIFIKSLNKFIEVKSTWTYEKDKEKIELTKKRVEEEGYIFECWIFNAKKELFIIL